MNIEFRIAQLTETIEESVAGSLSLSERYKMDDRFKEMLAEGPANDEEAYELEEYVQNHIDSIDKLRQQIFDDIEDSRNRYRQLGREIDSYRSKIKCVLPDFGG